MKRIFFSCFLLFACNKTNFIQVGVTETGKETFEALEEITKDLNKAIGCSIIDSSKQAKRRWVTIRSDDPLLKSVPNHPWGMYMYYSDEIVFLSKLKADEYKFAFRFVLLHELGHAFGLDHEPNTVMREQFDAKEMSYPKGVESLVALLNSHGKNPCVTELEEFLKEDTK